MKILHVVHNFPPEFVGGTEAYLAALVECQRKRGLDVRVVTGSEQPTKEPLEEDWRGCRVTRLGHDPALERYSVHFQIPRLMEPYGRILAEERPDLLHVHHYLNLGIPLVGMAAVHGIPAVVTLHDFTTICPRFFLIRPDGAFCGDLSPIPDDRCRACCREEYAGSEEQLAGEFDLRRAFFEEELGLAAKLLVPSEQAAGYLRQSGLLPERLSFEALPLGLLREYRPVPRKPGPAGRMRLVSFGNLAPVKGMDLLLDALAGLGPESRARVSLLLLGECTEEALARRIAAGLPGLELRHEGRFDAARLERLPAEVDLAVFPGTAAETYSLVVDEALALGLPVIVSDRGAAAERAGPAGIVVPPGDPDALRAVLEELLAQPQRLEQLRQAVAPRPLTLPEHERRLLALYEAVLNRGAEASPAAASGAESEFDVGHTFPPLLDLGSIPGGHVVVLAPHQDDEVIGAGGAMALHAARGDRVTVVHLTDGGRGDRESHAGGRIRSVRKLEARAAGEVLGVSGIESLDFPDGGLRPGGAFLAGLTGLLSSLSPDLIYVPSPFEHHPDHRATLELAAGAILRLEPMPQVLLYEVNESQPASFLLDITSVLDQKARALRKFESQRVYLDVAENTLAVNRARTSNVNLAEVEAVEAYFRVAPERLSDWISTVTALRRRMRDVAGMPVESEQQTEQQEQRVNATVPVSVVISTWNKKDDVRENLLALLSQTRLPAEIIVVDNASKDGTQEMIRAEFPGVRLIEMPHDRKGACETFNIGFKAASQPLTAIMDDDVVAPPEWLATLVERLEREPETTAMVSSKVVEPGMPDEFLSSPAVNQERYMATFRGCGTLARSEVLRQAGYYDERFFIYGNERDLSARVLSLGHRILQCPRAEIFHKTPFGMKAGQRSLYYHVRNFWLYAFKHCSWRQVLRAGWVLGGAGLGFRRSPRAERDASAAADATDATDATGTIGLDRAVKDVPGGVWIAIKASLAAFCLLPYCLKRRRVCRAPDFEPPVL